MFFVVKNTLRSTGNPEFFNLGSSSVTQNFYVFKTNQIHSTCQAVLADNTSLSPPIVNDSLRIYHQNVQRLKWKTKAIINFLYPDLPHILCFPEHRLNHYEVDLIHTDICSLGTKHCRHYLNKDGVCIFVHTN